MKFFLDKEYLRGVLKDAKIKESSIILDIKQIKEIENLIELNSLEEIKKGRCLFR